MTASYPTLGGTWFYRAGMFALLLAATVRLYADVLPGDGVSLSFLKFGVVLAIIGLFGGYLVGFATAAIRNRGGDGE